MALIFTLLVFAIGYGLQWLLSSRAIGRARRRGRLDVGSLPMPAAVQVASSDTVTLAVERAGGRVR